MYSVFLVEDEIVVREGIRDSIPWDQTPYALAGEAPDGEMALSIIKDVKPDILVTDIKMPFMDGLALARIVKKTQPWVKIIILSGHDEFQYAKEAISIGVEEYLLKPVSASELLEAFGKIVSRIEDEKRKLDSMENLKQRVQTTTEMLRERWLCDLVTGLADTEKALDQARENGVELIARSYAVIIAELGADGENFREISKAKRTVLSYTGAGTDVISFSFGADRIVCIVKSNAQETLEESVYTFAQGIKFDVERNTRCTLAIAIGTPTERIGGIPHSYSDALRAMKYLSATGRRVIVGINDIQTMEKVDFAKLGSDPVADRLRYVIREDIECLVDQYMGMLGDKPLNTHFIGYYLLYDIVVAASAIIAELNGDIKAIIPSGGQQEYVNRVSGSRELFEAEVRRIIGSIVDLREAKGASRYCTMIQRAKRYIDTHFADPDISLHTVASFVNVSPNHFSTIFSQEAGESFIEYLTCTRIEQAKRLLLSTQMKSADIGYAVGFNDPHYFSFIFKKNAGMAPRDFRSEKNARSE
jgi:two-component system, response regulator YesN